MPPKPKKLENSKPLQIWVDGKIHSELKYIAIAQDRTLQTLCRMILKNYVMKAKK